MIARKMMLMAGLLAFSGLAGYSADVSGNSGSLESEPTGRWLTASRNLEVELVRSGEGFTGTVSRVISDRAMNGSEPGPAPAGTPPLLGLKILEDLVPSGKNEWQGRIYNRDNGKTYDCVMTFVPPDQLNIRGYKFLPMFGKTQTWRRVGSINQ